MVVAPFKQGWLITSAIPKNDVWEFVSQGMIGPTLELVAPGLNLLTKAAAHTWIEQVMEGDDDAKYGKRTYAEFLPLPYLDILEIDWREMGSFWSLSISPPARHLTISYRDATGETATLTIVGGGPMNALLKVLFMGRFSQEILAANVAVAESLVPPAAYAELLADFNARHSEVTKESLDELVSAYAKTRTQYLIDHGITDEFVAAKTREQVLATFERYRGLPELDGYAEALKTPASAATPTPAQN